MTMFNGYIMTNWSGATNRTTGANSIFVVSLIDGKEEIENFSTRVKARDYIACMIDKPTKNGKPLLIGFDFPFGYPESAYGDFKCKNWENLSRLINKRIMDDIDGNKNKNNRFDVGDEFNKCFPDSDGPFWGHRTDKNYKVKHCNLFNKRPENYGDGLPLEFRHVEYKIKEQTGKQAKSVWQLFGNGCVGSKTLMGIPTLQELKQRGDCCVWPFQDLDKTKHVIAEIYPAIWDKKNQPAMTIKERLCRTLKIISCLDKNKRLQDFLNAPDTHGKNIIKKEGWILGVDENGNPAQCP